jgi:hypothetical protein
MVDRQSVEVAIGLLTGDGHSHRMGVIIDGANARDLGGQIGIGQRQGTARAAREDEQGGESHQAAS